MDLEDKMLVIVSIKRRVLHRVVDRVIIYVGGWGEDGVSVAREYFRIVLTDQNNSVGNERSRYVSSRREELRVVDV